MPEALNLRAKILTMSDDWSVDVLLEGVAYLSTCTLLTSGRHRVLVDTGLPLQEERLLAGLRSRAIEPADIDIVVNTHLHIDHCTNNALFPRAAIMLSREEWRWASAFYDAVFTTRAPERAAVEFYPEIGSYKFQPRLIRNVARLARMFWNPARLGDPARFRWLEDESLPPGLQIMPTPGHTPHHVSVLVAGPRPTILAGDTVLSEDGHAKTRTMIPYSRALFEASRERVLQAGALIVPGHGPAFLPRSAAGA
jgi:glyoxylase-like metal-dependent hydrolase (beta-lactamase superfamily II)